MKRSPLHEFDLALCAHVIVNIRWNLNKIGIFDRVRQLDSRLAKVLIDEQAPNVRVAPVPPLLLNDAEFSEIIQMVQFLPMQSIAHWSPHESLYQMATLATGEIRCRLAPADADCWAARSQKFAMRLQSRLMLFQGIEVVQEWTADLRIYLEALAEFQYLPRPQGQFPTPSHPAEDGKVDVEMPPPEIAYLDRLRAVIDKHPDGPHAKPDELIALAKVNNRLGRKALRILKEQGEYDGFKRDTPGRYQTEPS